MAKKPNKEKIIRIFGQIFWDQTGKYIEHETLIQAVKTKHIGEDFVSHLEQRYTLNNAITEPLEEGVEWWRPLIYDGDRWAIHYCPAPWWKADSHPIDRFTRLTKKLCDLLIQEDHSNVCMKKVVLAYRQLMDCPAVCEVDEAHYEQAKDYLDEAIHSLGAKPAEGTWNALFCALNAGKHDVLQLTTESISEHTRKAMPHALRMMDSTIKLTPRDMATAKVWEEFPGLKKEDMIEKLIARGVYETVELEYRLVGEEKTLTLESFGDYLSRLKRKLKLQNVK